MDIDMAKELFVSDKPFTGNKLPIQYYAEYVRNELVESGCGEKGLAQIDRAVLVTITGTPHRDSMEILKDAIGKALLDASLAAYAMFKAGCMFENLRDYKKAAKCYDISIDLNVPSPEASYWQFNNLGFCLNYLKDFAGAEKMCRIAINMIDERHNAWKNLGIALEHQGRLTEAMDAYKCSIERANTDPRPQHHLERLIKRQKERLERELGV